MSGNYLCPRCRTIHDRIQACRPGALPVGTLIERMAADDAEDGARDRYAMAAQLAADIEEAAKRAAAMERLDRALALRGSGVW